MIKIKYIIFQVPQRVIGPITKFLRIAFSFKKYKRRVQLSKISSFNDSDEKFKKNGMIIVNSYFDDIRLKDFSKQCRNLHANNILSRPGRLAKEFFNQHFTEEDIAFKSEPLSIALNENILEALAKYFGIAAYLESVDLLESKKVKSLSQSQYWHLDRTDSKVAKLFIYCNDVLDNNGPFTYLSKDSSGQVNQFFSKHYLDDQEIISYIDLDRYSLSVKGDAGTAFLIDTRRCYHFGSRCEQPRLAYIAYYNTGFSYFKRLKKWKIPEDAIGSLSDLQKCALGIES